MLLYKLIHWIKSFFERVIAPRLRPIAQRLGKFSNTPVGQVISVILFPLYLVFRYIGWFFVVFLIPLAFYGKTTDLACRAFGVVYGGKGSWVIFALTFLLLYVLPILSAFLYSNEQDDREEERDRHGRELAKAQEELRAKQWALDDERRQRRSERQERAELQERVLQLQQELKEKVEAAREEGLSAGIKEGYDSGRDAADIHSAAGRCLGREEGYTLGHSEGYKYALYTLDRFHYYTGEPPLSYGEAEASLAEGENGCVTWSAPLDYDELIAAEKRAHSATDGSGPELPDWEYYDDPYCNYDEDGYDYEGYDRQGFDCYGYDRRGYDRYGLDVNGIDDQGYNAEGYDCYGNRRIDYYHGTN